MEPQQTKSTNPIDAIQLPSTVCCGGHSRQWIIASIIAVVAGLLVGGGVYAVMGRRLSSERTVFTQQITNLQNQLAQLQTIVPAKTEDDISNWKTYQNAKYGYEVKYPPTFWLALPLNSGGVEISYEGPREQKLYTANLKIETRKIVLDDFIKEYNNAGRINEQQVSSIYKTEPYAVNGINATKLTGSTDEGVDVNYIFITKDSNSFIMEYFNPDESFLEQPLNTIISTFKFIDSASAKTIDQSAKEVTTGISKSLPISFNMPLSWSAAVDFYEGVLGGAAGPKNETTFRIALDENPILIAGLGHGYPVVVYGINEKSEAKYRSFFDNISYEELSIAGATKVVRTSKAQGIGGYYQDVYIMRGNKIYVVGYDVKYTKVADKILQSWRFLQ